jgi:hypothetical protein
LLNEKRKSRKGKKDDLSFAKKEIGMNGVLDF